ncbi:MAG TPA: O-antigen ligase family protein [Steroidobacteraceae bacterium]|nr:O-antigen ligase family protein [Steroidobacteraceae bacterium]
MLGTFTYLAVLLAVIVGSVLRPPIALAGVLILFGLKQWGQNASPWLAQYPLLTNVAIGVVTLVAVLRAAFKRGCLFCSMPPAEICAIGLFLYALVTLTWSLDLESGLANWVYVAPYLIVVVLMAPLVVDDLEGLRTTFVWTALLGGGLCFLAVVFGTWGYRGLAVTQTAPIGSLLDRGPQIFETNPLALASLGGTVMVAGSTFLLERRATLLRVLAACALPFALAVIIRSGSRGQLVAALPALFLAASVAFKLRGFRSWAVLGLLSMLIVGMGWWATSLVEVNKSRWLGSELAEGDVEGRFEMAAAVLDAAVTHPLAMFIGLGNSSSFKLLGIYPHITILEVLAEEGLPGIALYLAVLFYAARSVRRAARALTDEPRPRVALGILAGLFLYELLLSWKQGSLLGSQFVFCFAFLLGRLELALNAAPHRRPATLEQVPVRAFPNLLT